MAAAKSASTAVVVVADDTETEAADRPSLDLPSAQNELISAVATANPHTVVVINAGAPVAMPWLTRVAAVVDAWYPGQTSGTALASVLFGNTDPGGHLPVTFPRNLAQVPAAPKARFPGVNGKVHYSEGLDVGYRWYDAKAISPLFPFGFGLSYTTFGYNGLPLRGTFTVTSTPAARQAVVTAPPRIPAGKPVTVSVRLTASGNQTLHGVKFTLSAPQGWLVRPLGSPVISAVSSGQAPIVKFTVQPPLYAPNTSSVLYATIGLGGSTVRQGGATVTVTR